MSLRVCGALLLLFLSTAGIASSLTQLEPLPRPLPSAAGQENEVECLTECGTSSSILSVVRNVVDCCFTRGGGAFNFPGAGRAVDCASCEDFRSKSLSQL